MDIEWLLRKLEPLLPTQVAHWRKVREVGDPELKALIEKHVFFVAQSKLGDFQRRILLSLPPESQAKGKFHLGTVLYDKEKWAFGISEKELLQNLAIFGRSGAGKTNVAFLLLRQLEAERIPFVFLDWKRTARHLIPLLRRRVNLYTPGRSLSPFAFNPFLTPPGLESNVYINQVEDVITELEKIHLKERARGWRISAIRALETLIYSQVTGDGASQEEMVAALLEESTIVELDALDQASKEFLIPLLCLWIFYVKLAETDRERLKLVIFIEEAHHVLYGERKKETLLEQLLRQCRELGIAFVVVDQHPHLISSAALGNTYTTICLNLKDPKDISRAAGLSLLEDREKDYLSMLPVGQGIVKLQDRWRRPFLVQFPLVDVSKGSVTDDDLKRYLKDKSVIAGGPVDGPVAAEGMAC